VAKVQFGAVVTDARKKIGGTVFSKSKFGSYIRKKVSPVQPRTAAQRAVRANFTANAKAWSGTLTTAERLTFTNLAATLTKKDRFGNAQTLTGAQLYNSIARNLHTIGVAPLSTAPSNMSVSDLGGAALTQTATPSPSSDVHGLELTLTNEPATDEYLVVAGAAPQPAGRAFIGKGKYRVLGTFGPWPGSPALGATVVIDDIYCAKFGALAAGQTIHVLAYNINSANGAKGTPYPATITIATSP
jgi:hypothetical protein